MYTLQYRQQQRQRLRASDQNHMRQQQSLLQLQYSELQRPQILKR